MSDSRPLPLFPISTGGSWSLSRRHFLHVGVIGGLGLTLPSFLQIRAQQAAGAAPAAPSGAGAAALAAAKFAEPKAKAVIHLYLPGGIAQQECFDPKPYAPIEYRGPFGAIDTKVTGLQFSQHFPRMAGVADRMTVVRTMSHGEAAHERGAHNMFTGYRPSPAIQYPSIGSVLSHELGPKTALPPYVCVPSLPNIYAGSGYLNSAYGPFSLGSDPANNGFQVRDLNAPNGVDDARYERRKSMLDAVDEHFKQLEKADAIDASDSFYQAAYALLASPAAKAAFDLKAEPDAIRDEYGRHAAGQRLLLARRLVEAGVRFVSLSYGGWDHHDNIAGAFPGQAAQLDQGFATLITDLERRGLLDSTLVLITTEFGRTPKINRTEGRDHWPRVFSIVLAGGGIKRGAFYGTSNSTCTEPDDVALGVEEWAHTIYALLGIDAEKKLLAPGNRPIAIVKGGRLVKELLA
jgi:hypothetical protein